MYKIAAYSQNDSEVRELSSPSEVSKFLNKWPVVWLDCTSPKKEDIEVFEKIFNFHKLALEDSFLKTTQRPKVDNYTDYFFLVMRVVEYRRNDVKSYQLSMFIGKNYLVTISEKKFDFINSIFKRIEEKSQKILESGPDYLCYLILDIVIDDYFSILDKIDDEIEFLEREAIEKSPKFAKEFINKIFILKKDLLLLRKTIFPTMEMLLCVQRGDLPNISKETNLHLNDVLDHITEIVDLLETSREMVSSALEIHFSRTQNVINEIAKILTVFACVLMFPTVIAGIYGMNFQYQPEYHWPYGYYLALFLMLISVAGSLIYFKRKGWI